MPDVQSEKAQGKSDAPPESGALFRLLVAGNRDAGQVYTAVREIESMAGQTAVQQLTALIRATAAEQTAQFQTGLTAVNARLDAVEKQLGRIWAFLFLLLATLLGTLTTLVTTLLLRG